MVKNEYLERLRAEVPYSDWGFCRGFKTFYINGKEFKDYRRGFVTEYAWAIPDDNALKHIAAFTNSICEIGAGTGYWASLLAQMGVSVAAFDIAVPTQHDNSYRHTKLYHEVRHGDVLTINQHQSKTLMLCWPPYARTMAEAALKLYTGKKVIYIGEGEGGCTATDEFHTLLFDLYNVERIDLLNWDGIHDSLYLGERKC